eukprot:scaffold54876_cov75-Phaeocystis_antarctica.AAC.3
MHRVDERRLEATRELILGSARTYLDPLPAALRRGERRWGCGRALGCAHAWRSGDVLKARNVWASGGGAHLDGQLDRRVVARLEVEELALVRAAPVAAVEDVALLHVERRRDELAVCSPAREDEAQPMAVPLGQHHEELLVEVLSPQQPLVDGALIHVEGERE